MRWRKRAGIGSNRAMTTPDARLTELEIKASYADDLLDHLNGVVARQQQQIDLLVREVARLNRQLGEAAAASGGAGARDPRDEIPPHW